MTLWPTGPWVSGVYWTLAIEIVFYLLVAILLATRRPRALDELGVGLAIVGSCYWLLRLADFSTGGHFKAVFGIIETAHGGLFLIGNAVHFGFGLLLWSIVREGATRSRMRLMIACVAGGLVSTAATARFSVALNGEPISRIAIAPTIYLAGACAIVCAVAANGWLLRQFGQWTGVARTLGLLTYPLYLVHSELGERLMRLVASLGGWGALAFGLAGVIAIAALALRLERYPRRLILAWAAPRRAERQPMSELP